MSIAYLVNGGSRLSACRKMFPDVDADGWYWLDLDGNAHLMNKSSFFKVFKQASHYGFQPTKSRLESMFWMK